MKKLLLFLLCLTLTVGSLSGCEFMLLDESASNESFAENSAEEQDVCTVTFKQEGQEDIIKEVRKGEALTDIPTPLQRIGYTVEWSVQEYLNITESITVNALSAPNEYIITYYTEEGTVAPATQTVTYDAIPETFATPTREGYSFVCWTYEGKAVQPTDAWKIPNDVTLIATWIEKEKRTVSFVQDGYEPITVEVFDGDTLTKEDIPSPQPKMGYTVVWEEKDLTNVMGNITVNAIATPNTYTVCYDAGEGSVDVREQVMTYDAVPKAVPTPVREGYKFKGWTYEGYTVYTALPWYIADDVTLTAKWAKIYTVTLNVNGGDALKEETVTVVYGERYTLPTPTRAEYNFTGWKYGTKKVAVSGVWSIEAEQITLSASWRDADWTQNY